MVKLPSLVNWLTPPSSASSVPPSQRKPPPVRSKVAESGAF